jgi:hypothetical protein
MQRSAPAITQSAEEASFVSPIATGTNHRKLATASIWTTLPIFGGLPCRLKVLQKIAHVPMLVPSLDRIVPAGSSKPSAV